MSRYHRYRHKYYRRPYYSRYGYSNDSRLSLKLFFVICLLAFFALFSGNLVISTLFWYGIIICIIILIYKKTRRQSKSSSSQASLDINQHNESQINSEKHGCKCYMEGLTDGEREVADTLSHGLSYKDYFIFNNLIIPSKDNLSTQIDHIVVSKFGIFVIESKDFNGWIFGDERQSQWTQSLPGGNNKFQFQNPIHQNYEHIMSLKALIPSVANNLVSIVVFSGKSEIKTAPIENVVHINELVGCIKKYTEVKINENDLQLTIGKLSYACQTNDVTLSQHVTNLEMHHNN